MFLSGEYAPTPTKYREKSSSKALASLTDLRRERVYGMSVLKGPFWLCYLWYKISVISKKVLYSTDDRVYRDIFI